MRDYLGIPFAESGRTRAGVDCLGLVMLVYRERLGIEVPEPGYAHTRDAAIAGMVESALGQWQRVEVPQRFDVALFRGRLWHVGLMVNARQMLHVNEDHDACIDYLEPMWLPRLKGFYRYAG